MFAPHVPQIRQKQFILIMGKYGPAVEQAFVVHRPTDRAFEENWHSGQRTKNFKLVCALPMFTVIRAIYFCQTEIWVSTDTFFHLRVEPLFLKYNITRHGFWGKGLPPNMCVAYALLEHNFLAPISARDARPVDNRSDTRKPRQSVQEAGLGVDHRCARRYYLFLFTKQ